MSFAKSLISNPALIMRHRNIFLLSHMRANTSLFAHLIGSHPEIEGYYEMHIGYYSWKSLWRQKIRHFSSHTAKPQAVYMFDKVLHIGHNVDIKLLQRRNTRVIIMLREPVQSIKSLIALYRKRNPHLPEAEPDGATQYYIERLTQLNTVASAMVGRYFYLDAESLITNSEPTLAILSDWLQLTLPIAPNYNTFAKTGQGNSGDHSSRLKTGKIQRKKSDYSSIELSDELCDAAQQAYWDNRSKLIEGSQLSALAPSVS